MKVTVELTDGPFALFAKHLAQQSCSHGDKFPIRFSGDAANDADFDAGPAHGGWKTLRSGGAMSLPRSGVF